ncbi:MAG: sigma-70 family RNA polymerase sigma factor [Clostridia bacterium]|nr:sigma-70 family RNA polymerase sigma factor [Clostridia bacterium]
MQKRSVDAEKLIIRAKSGDDEAFSELVEVYHPLLSRLTASFVSCALTYDEAFSEACFAFHRAVKSFKVGQSEVTFGLYARICVRRHLQSFAASLRHEEAEPLDSELPASDDGMQALLGKERVESLMSYLKADLSEYEYKVLLYHIQGYTTAQIAEALSRSPKSVDNAKSRVFRRAREHGDLS